MHYPASRCLVLGALLVLAGLAGSGCDSLGSNAPTEAELRLDGADGTRAEIVVSTNFLSQQQPVFDDDGILIGDTLIVELLDVQTLTVTLPFERSYDISDHHQFYAQIRRLNPEADELHARLFIDGAVRGERTPPAALATFTLVYNFLTRPVDGGGDEV